MSVTLEFFRSRACSSSPISGARRRWTGILCANLDSMHTDTTTYLLRDIPDAIHAPARAKAAREGRAIRWILLAALSAYADGAWTPASTPEPARRKSAPSLTSRRRRTGTIGRGRRRSVTP